MRFENSMCNVAYEILKEVNEKVIPISEGIKSLRVALAVKDSMEKNQIIEL